MAAALVSAFILLLAGRKGYARRIIYTLVCEAEKRFGAGSGNVKFAEVFATFYLSLPSFLQVFFSEKLISTIIEECVARLKASLADE